MGTAIEWTDETWNPTTGCTKVSPGCDHCYAERITERFHGPGSFDTVTLHPDRLELPIHWRKPRRVFVNSMSDLFHDDVPDEFIAAAWCVMYWTSARARTYKPKHTYQILTKRHARMRSWVRRWADVDQRVAWVAAAATRGWVDQYDKNDAPFMDAVLPNVWLGVSVEDQHWADIRIPTLLSTPAAVRFVSCEPLLGRVDMAPTYWLDPGAGWPRIDWVIVGGESGAGARPMHSDWACAIRDQCVTRGVAFFFKQWGGRSPKAGGRELDGRTWDEYPQVVPA